MLTHYDEETLFGYLDRSASADENGAIEAHLESCGECKDLFRSVQEFFSAIDAREVWADEEMRLPHVPIDSRRVEAAIDAARLATEGAAESERILATLLANPVEE
ncbi:MAG TPA: zf-HC2 domain-containing protein, partial [Thermoanaerobaculia bacterium]